MSKKLTSKSYQFRRCPYCLNVFVTITDTDRIMLNMHIEDCKRTYINACMNSFKNMRTIL